MDSRFYVFFVLLSWFYLSIAIIYQQHAQVSYCDKNYFRDAKAITFRHKRGGQYFTNVTIDTRYPLSNNVSIKLVVDLKHVGSTVFYDKRFCDSFNVSWFKQLIESLTNITSVCPVPPGRYDVFNLELPPKNFPLPVPKGEGTLSFYMYKTSNKQHLLKVVESIVSK